VQYNNSGAFGAKADFTFNPGNNTLTLGDGGNLVAEGVNSSGTIHFGDADDLEIPNGAAPTVDTAGQIAIDTTITDYTGLIKYHDGTEELSVVAMPTANLSTTDGDVVKYNAANNEFEMGSVAAAGFGGDGSDGALTVSSGTTDIDLGGDAVVVKNYTSISITGTGAVTFSNPHTNGTIVILKSQGGVTLTSSATPMLDLQGGGAQIVSGAAGNSGRIATPLYLSDFGEKGQNGQNGTNSSGGVAGTGQNSNSPVTVYATLAQIGDYAVACGGAGGAGGDNQSTSGSPGDGGAGGGALVIECAGALNFTTSGGISVAGVNGTNGGAATEGAGGGGGGAGGTALILYNTLTAASGTITVSGGTGGNGATGGSQSPGSGGSGGNGSSGSANGGTGGQGGSASGAGGGGAGGGGGAFFFGTSNGSTGGAGGDTGTTNQAPGGGGGGGASGYAVITQNKGS